MKTYTDPRNKTITYGYDKASNRTSVEGPVQGNAAATPKDSGGCSCSCECDPCAVPTDHGTYSFSYDNRNRPENKKNQSGDITTTAHDAAGNCTTATVDAVGSTSDTVVMARGYDAQDRVKWIMDGNGKYVTFTYDAAGRQETVKDPDNNAKKSEEKGTA